MRAGGCRRHDGGRGDGGVGRAWMRAGGSVAFSVTMLGFTHDRPDAEGVVFVRRHGGEIMFAWPNAHMPFERPQSDRRRGGIGLRTPRAF